MKLGYIVFGNCIVDGLKVGSKRVPWLNEDGSWNWKILRDAGVLPTGREDYSFETSAPVDPRICDEYREKFNEEKKLANEVINPRNGRNLYDTGSQYWTVEDEENAYYSHDSIRCEKFWKNRLQLQLTLASFNTFCLATHPEISAKMTTELGKLDTQRGEAFATYASKEGHSYIKPEKLVKLQEYEAKNVSKLQQPTPEEEK